MHKTYCADQREHTLLSAHVCLQDKTIMCGKQSLLYWCASWYDSLCLVVHDELRADKVKAVRLVRIWVVNLQGSQSSGVGVSAAQATDNELKSPQRIASQRVLPPGADKLIHTLSIESFPSSPLT